MALQHEDRSIRQDDVDDDSETEAPRPVGNDAQLPEVARRRLENLLTTPHERSLTHALSRRATHPAAAAQG
ncbi:MAG: hypothetical protein ACR2H3_16595 [Acidimicrobiales bacterium]